MKRNLFGTSPRRLQALVSDLGMPAYRGRQIAEWLYPKAATSIEEMTNLSKADRARLNEHFEIRLESPMRRLESRDGTVKYAFAATGATARRRQPNAAASGAARARSRPLQPDGPAERLDVIETTLIPEARRLTVCLSSQIGCARGCTICATGRLGFHGNLQADEILNQYRSIPERERVTNFVYMGMGEPLDNLDEVLESIEVITGEAGYAMSPRRITVSTIGILEPLERLLSQSEVHVAVSLHSPFPEERARLVPAERQNPLQELRRLLRAYRLDGRRRLSFEYALIARQNDTPRHARAVADLARELGARVNLIPLNRLAAEDAGLAPPATEEVEAFRRGLQDRGARATVRRARGADIEAACGLLAGRL